MNPRELIQGSEPWRLYKCGRLGASSISDMLTRTKTGWGAGRDNLAARLVTERLTGCPSASYTSKAMENGTALEGQARSLYSVLKNVDVEQIGWADHPTIAWSGASPDGLVSGNGLIEIKCPMEATHLRTLKGGSIDGGYMKQMMWQMAVLDRQWCDFVSFCPSFPPEMALHIERVARDDVVIANLELEAMVFLKEVEDTVNQLRAKYQLAFEYRIYAMTV
jgi:hypothetical protein